MFKWRCFRPFCKKPTTPKSEKPYLPPELLMKIASSPKTRAAMSRATNKYTRRTLPIGLAVTTVGASLVPRARPPAINRSRAVAKAVPLRFSKDPIDRKNPAAYKNNTWQFYDPYRRHHILFSNTRNGQPFLINKNGTRKPVPAKLLEHQRYAPQPRKPAFHTWEAYTKRYLKNRRIAGGQGARNAKRAQMNMNIQRHLNGNTKALNKYSLSNMVWWANPTNWMSANGQPYVKYKGYWARYGSNGVLTKNDIINDIKLKNSLRN